MQRFFLVYVFLLLNCFALCAQDDPYYIRYDTKDGLPSSEVYDVEIDSLGLIWFTTDRGVCTYDGYEFKTYTTQDGLADNTNFDIYRDSRQRLWFNGYSGRASIFENGIFRSYVNNDSLLTHVKGKWLGDMMETEDGSIFSSSYSMRGLKLLSLNEEEPIESVNETQVKNSLKTIDVEHGLIVNSGEVFIHYLRGKAIAKRSYRSYTVQMAEYFDDSVLYYFKETLYKTDLKGNKLNQFRADEIITKIYVDDQRNIWLCTTNEVLFFKEGNLDYKPKTYFKGYQISNIAKDKEGGIWLTTNQNGILFIPSFEIDHFQLSNNQKVKERYLSVGKLKEHIYFGTSDSKIMAINKDLEFKVIDDSKNNLSQIRYIIENDGELHYSNDRRIKEENGQVVFTKSFIESVGYSKKMMNGHFFTFQGIGFKIQSDTEVLLVTSSQAKNPFRENLTTMVQTQNEDIWLGALKGLFKISNYDYDNVERVASNEQDRFGRISDIYLDAAENKWIATVGNGLFYHTSDTVFQIKKADGLNSNLINQIMMLNDSTLLLGTNRGLNVLNYRFDNTHLEVFNIRSLTTADGLSSNYINDLEFWEDKIWLATNNGICSFDPALVNKTYKAIPLYINELIVNDSSYSIDEELVFEHDENDVFINFTGISFKKENEKPFYRYRLKTIEGIPQWFYTNEKNIRYNNMSPGEYIFEVAARNKSEQWTEVPASIAFTINPYFTDTLWFRTFAILFSIGLIVVTSYFQIKRIRSKEIAKHQLQEAQLRTRDAELAALRNQMNPHFVFNSLNSIQNFIFKKDIEKANYYLSRFSELMRNSLQYSRLDFISLRQELNFIKDYIELESMRFADQFDFEINVDEELELDFAMIPSLMIQPVLENAVKHAFKNIKYKGKLQIDFLKKGENGLDIYIKDNGPGLSNNTATQNHINKKHKSLGLEIIQNRIKLLNEANHKIEAKFDIINSVDKNNEEIGLEVHFVLPIKYKA